MTKTGIPLKQLTDNNFCKMMRSCPETVICNIHPLVVYFNRDPQIKVSEDTSALKLFVNLRLINMFATKRMMNYFYSGKFQSKNVFTLPI